MATGRDTLSMILKAPVADITVQRDGRVSRSRPRDAPSDDIRIGLLLAGLFFVLFLGWAAIARLDAAVLAPGRLVVSGQRQSVQHRDGGVIDRLLVHEGQRVEKGQLLLTLVASELKAQERAFSAQAIGLLAQRARIEAEETGSPTITPPVEFQSISDPEGRVQAARAMQLQAALLASRRKVMEAHSGALQQRISEAGNAGEGYRRQVAGLDEQIRSIDEELASLRVVAEKGFVSRSRLRTLERARADLIGARGRYSSSVAQSQDQAGEARLEAVQVRSDFLDRATTEHRDVELSLNELLPKLAAARDQLKRAEIRSPASGTIVGLTVFTVGGVVEAGARLMDVVPERVPMMVEIRVNPEDSDDLMPGQTALVRMDALHERSLQPLEGKVSRVSADRFVDEKNGMAFFTATIEVPQAQLDLVRAIRGRNFEFRAGMPVTVEIPVRKRTALQYLFEPLLGRLRRTGREQ